MVCEQNRKKEKGGKEGSFIHHSSIHSSITHTHTHTHTHTSTQNAGPHLHSSIHSPITPTLKHTHTHTSTQNAAPHLQRDGARPPRAGGHAAPPTRHAGCVRQERRGLNIESAVSLYLYSPSLSIGLDWIVKPLKPLSLSLFPPKSQYWIGFSYLHH